jgi:hypothetical protein
LRGLALHGAIEQALFAVNDPLSFRCRNWRINASHAPDDNRKSILCWEYSMPDLVSRSNTKLCRQTAIQLKDSTHGDRKSVV